MAVGGTNQAYLQPKLLKSAFEKDSLWPGRIVRCFEGEYLRFSTFICSDLLNRPGSSSYMDWLADELDKHEERLTFAIWLQHNEKPRSAHFSNAIEAIGRMQHNTTAIVAGSRQADQRHVER